MKRIKEEHGTTQNAVADMFGVSPGAISDLRKVIQPNPSPETILKLGGLIPKSDGRHYTGIELLAIACSWEEAPKKKQKPVEYTGPNEKAVKWLRRKVGNEAIASIAERCNIPKETIEDMLNGAEPTWVDVTNLSMCLGWDFNEVFALYGIDPKAKIKSSGDGASKTKTQNRRSQTKKSD
ncbi:MAG: helix-turn-helix transcriptional regulator [Cyanobacteria bacterium P01_E01_bin.6]